MGLASKLHCGAGELSGGQRRKLSVAIAFLGDPAVVFLVGGEGIGVRGLEHCVLFLVWDEPGVPNNNCPP